MLLVCFFFSFGWKQALLSSQASHCFLNSAADEACASLALSCCVAGSSNTALYKVCLEAMMLPSASAVVTTYYLVSLYPQLMYAPSKRPWRPALFGEVFVLKREAPSSAHGSLKHKALLLNLR